MHSRRGLFGWCLLLAGAATSTVLLALGPTEGCRLEEGVPLRDILLFSSPPLIVAGWLFLFTLPPRPKGFIAIAAIAVPPFLFFAALNRLASVCAN